MKPAMYEELEIVDLKYILKTLKKKIITNIIEQYPQNFKKFNKHSQ